MNKLTKWEKATQELTDLFLEKYFDKDTDWYWIGNEVGSVLMANDYYFNLERIVSAIKYGATEKQLFDFYDKEMEALTKNKEMKINFKNYVALKEKKK